MAPSRGPSLAAPLVVIVAVALIAILGTVGGITFAPASLAPTLLGSSPIPAGPIDASPPSSPVASAGIPPSPTASSPVASSNGSPLHGPPLSANVTNDGFKLVMTVDHDRYRAGQPIRLTTTLSYTGPTAKARLWTNSAPGLVGFDVVQVDGPLLMPGGGTADCVRMSMTSGETRAIAFSKIGGWSNDDPFAGFYDSYYRDPQLRLPAGTWQISAKSGFTIGGSDCGAGHAADLRTGLQIVVEP